MNNIIALLIGESQDIISFLLTTKKGKFVEAHNAAGFVFKKISAQYNNFFRFISEGDWNCKFLSHRLFELSGTLPAISGYKNEMLDSYSEDAVNRFEIHFRQWFPRQFDKGTMFAICTEDIGMEYHKFNGEIYLFYK